MEHGQPAEVRRALGGGEERTAQSAGEDVAREEGNLDPRDHLWAHAGPRVIGEQHDLGAYAAAVTGGPEGFASLPDTDAGIEDALDEAFQEAADSEDLLAAAVLEATPQRVTAIRPDSQRIEIAGEGLRFAQRALTDKVPANIRTRRGALTRVTRDDKGAWSIVQLPQVEAAFVPLDPATRLEPLDTQIPFFGSGIWYVLPSGSPGTFVGTLWGLPTDWPL